MQRSGGSAPRASISPRASRRTAAAAGEAVETMPPPRPHSSCGGVTLRARDRPLAALGDRPGGPRPSSARAATAESAAASAISSSLASASSRSASRTVRRQRQGEGDVAGAEAVAEGQRPRSGACRSVSASPIGSPKSSVGPSCRGSSSLGLAVAASAIGGKRDLVEQRPQRVREPDRPPAGRGPGPPRATIDRVGVARPSASRASHRRAGWSCPAPSRCRAARAVRAARSAARARAARPATW